MGFLMFLGMVVVVIGLLMAVPWIIFILISRFVDWRERRRALLAQPSKRPGDDAV